MQTEVGKVSEPYAPHRGSSSTMPQKRNPISTVYITAIKQRSASLFDAMVEDRERSTGPWEIEWIVLPQISTLTHATLIHAQVLLEGLEVRPETMRRNLDITHGAIASESEAVMMALGKKVGRQAAHDLIGLRCLQEDGHWSHSDVAYWRVKLSSSVTVLAEKIWNHSAILESILVYVKKWFLQSLRTRLSFQTKGIRIL